MNETVPLNKMTIKYKDHILYNHESLLFKDDSPLDTYNLLQTVIKKAYDLGFKEGKESIEPLKWGENI